MDNIQKIQDDEYEFPYHHLVSIDPFSESRHLFWGYRYAAYTEKVIETLRKYNPNSIIDIGCGDGKITLELARCFPGKRVVGVDYSDRAIALARSFAPHIEFTQQTEEKFDAFVSIEVLEHIQPSEMELFLDGVCKNLKSGAVGIFTTPSEIVPVNPKHYQHFTKEKIQAVFERHFFIEQFEYISADSVGVAIIQRILANRFFILNYGPFVQWLYEIYKCRYLVTHKEIGRQLFVVVRKRQ